MKLAVSGRKKNKGAKEIGMENLIIINHDFKVRTFLWTDRQEFKITVLFLTK